MFREANMYCANPRASLDHSGLRYTCEKSRQNMNYHGVEKAAQYT